MSGRVRDSSGFSKWVHFFLSASRWGICALSLFFLLGLFSILKSWFSILVLHLRQLGLWLDVTAAHIEDITAYMVAVIAHIEDSQPS